MKYLSCFWLSRLYIYIPLPTRFLPPANCGRWGFLVHRLWLRERETQTTIRILLDSIKHTNTLDHKFIIISHFVCSVLTNVLQEGGWCERAVFVWITRKMQVSLRFIRVVPVHILRTGITVRNKRSVNTKRKYLHVLINLWSTQLQITPPLWHSLGAVGLWDRFIGAWTAGWAGRRKNVPHSPCACASANCRHRQVSELFILLGVNENSTHRQHPFWVGNGFGRQFKNLWPSLPTYRVSYQHALSG